MEKGIGIAARSAIGLDVGDMYSHYCIVGEDGTVRDEGRVRTTPDALRERFAPVEPSRIALEVGTHSPWISRLLRSCGHEVYVANAARLRLIHSSPRKNDRADAEALARLARLDPMLLAPIRHRGEGAQNDLARLRARAALVGVRTKLVNHVRGASKAVGGRLPRSSTANFPAKVTGAVPPELLPALSPLLSTIASLSAEIRRGDREIEKLASQRYPETALLTQVPGVGPITALYYVLTLEDPSRFRCSRSVAFYLGLTPRQTQSGEQDPERRIHKAGDRALRHLLVQCSHWILGPFGPDTDLRRWGLALASRGRKNAKKRAVVAVARKLAVLLHRLWTTGEVYELLHAGAYAAAPLLPRSA